MLALQYLSIFGLAASTVAQVSFGALENSAQILSLLKTTDQYTVSSGQSAARYKAGRQSAYQDLADENASLLQAWQAVNTAAESSSGFYSEQGAQEIIDFINNKLYLDTKRADQIYIKQRPEFKKGPRPFIDFINPGLIQLKVAVADAAAAVQQRTRATQLTPIILAFLNIAQDYSNTQEIQQFGPQTPVYRQGQCQCSGKGY
ncbi:hypothetical protein Slin15195_G004260 [Septoria linicola]|uniref:Uncharacterized protein n=1 Tax=Septoria linicola TaxID=215465 RepID=A0A9Q9ADT6_9PEZI|nr:hypothetical protein Slin14017_G004290 [Septoria linicola]USW47107.1 hypothetical protein Slin15195_G004260 [Septoria linicola]